MAAKESKLEQRAAAIAACREKSGPTLTGDAPGRGTPSFVIVTLEAPNIVLCNDPQCGWQRHQEVLTGSLRES